MLPFVLTFRNQNKDVWDVQHGSITPFHFAYNNCLLKKKSNLSPTGFFVYQKTAEAFLKRTNTKVCYFEKNFNKAKNKKTTVLITLQWGSKLPKSITNLIKKIRNKKVVLRMHPRDNISIREKFEDPLFYNFCANAKQIKIDNGSSPIEETLQSTYLHFTENSSVIHEAATKGILSFFWCSKIGPKMFQHEVKAGLARRLKIQEDLTKIISDYNL